MALDGVAHNDAVVATLAALFEVPVTVGVTDPRRMYDSPFAAEATHLARALPLRKREFSAGRAAARAAMAELGRTPQAVLAADDRAPLWPDGLRGSISHTQTLCAAVMTDRPFHLGLDLEDNTDLAPGLISTVCSDREAAAIAGPDQLRLAKLIFCAKEAAYKAQYPVTQKLFGFDHMEISLDLSRQRFTACFIKPVGPFAVGDTLPGRFDGVADHLVTGVWTGQDTPEGA